MTEWQNEPDQYNGTRYGLQIEVFRHPELGHLNGYVGVGKDHPLYGVNYDNVFNVDVHGGITYSNTRGGKEDTWWFGFDCAHVGDLIPSITSITEGTYRNMEYVKDQCEKLAQQLRTIGE